MADRINQTNKEQLGELFTPSHLVGEMLDTLPGHIFKNSSNKWLDPGCGKGQFSRQVLSRLDSGLRSEIKNDTERRQHIVRNMIHMVEINHEHEVSIKEEFGSDCNLHVQDFLSLNLGEEKFDVVVGNPPYNFNGLKKVPTNNKLEKKADGITPWVEFVQKAISLLKPGGYLLFIVPAIWMKPDKAKMYNFILGHRVEFLKAYSNTETNKLFSYSAQTPTCYFLLRNEPSTGVVPIYDRSASKLVPYSFLPSRPLPITGVSIVKKLQEFVVSAGHLKVKKTNMPSKLITFSQSPSETYAFPFVRTCHLCTSRPKLVMEYGNKPDGYRGKHKVILAHKMYGFPYFDQTGELGISNRDNYVISEYDDSGLERIKQFLSTDLCLFIYECTRYRMKYLEKYAFELIPDITKLVNFPTEINNHAAMKYFGLNESEKDLIHTVIGKRNYVFEHQ